MLGLRVGHYLLKGHHQVWSCGSILGTHFSFYWQLFFRRSEPRILEKSSNLKATFEPHIEEVKQLSFKMTYFQNLVPKLVRNLSNSIATFSLIFAKNTSNSSLDRKMELLIKKKSVYAVLSHS